MRRVGVGILFIALALPAAAIASNNSLPQPLQLPPGLVQTLPIVKEASYFGDAPRVVDCPDDKDNPYGTCGNLLFGGVALTSDFHLTGKIQIRFQPPVNGISHFQITHPGNLKGDDGVMKAPQYFTLPVRQNYILDPLDEVTSGDLNLITGEVTNFSYRAIFFNSLFQSLGAANPRVKAGAVSFPGPYGSAKAEFSQRADGLLDFTVEGSTFLPLGKEVQGDPVRFPLPFCGPDLQCGSVLARGTAFHPRVRISTKPLGGTACGNNCPQIPSNTIQEFTLFSHSSYIGDHFQLNIPEQGGDGIARVHLMGRFLIHFGDAAGGTSLPFTINGVLPKSLLAKPPGEAPFPGLSVGFFGHDEWLYFPLQTYFIGEVILADDPFDIIQGSIDLRTGRVIGNLNYRAFFSQDIAAVVRALNPSIVPESFPFRGTALFEQGPSGQTVFRFDGGVVLNAEGLIYPKPDLQSGWVAGPDAKFDLFLAFQAMTAPTTGGSPVMSGQVTNTTSSVGDQISYKYSISCDPVGKPFEFEYTNSNTSKGGTFKMQSLAAASCSNSRTSKLPPGQYDTVTFTGLGSWSRDSDLHAAAVQISTSPEYPYYSILIDGNLLSSANNKPVLRPVP